MSLFMPRIEANYSAADMIDAFYTSGIATLSRVAYKPYVVDNTLYFRAYANVSEWHDTESASNFITRLKDPKKETRFIYQEEDWFVVRIDPKPWLLDLSLCVVTRNHLLDDIDIDDRSGFMGLQPIDSDWGDINAIVSDALNEFNDEMHTKYELGLSDKYWEEAIEDDNFWDHAYESADKSADYSDDESDFKWDFDCAHTSDEDEFDGYSTDDSNPFETREKEMQFDMEAHYWYDIYTNDVLPTMKKQLTPDEFLKWKANREANFSRIVRCYAWYMGYKYK